MRFLKSVSDFDNFDWSCKCDPGVSRRERAPNSPPLLRRVRLSVPTLYLSIFLSLSLFPLPLLCPTFVCVFYLSSSFSLAYHFEKTIYVFVYLFNLLLFVCLSVCSFLSLLSMLIYVMIVSPVHLSVYLSVCSLSLPIFLFLVSQFDFDVIKTKHIA